MLLSRREFAQNTLGALSIKFTQACLREHRVAPAPELLAAAEDACRRLR